MTMATAVQTDRQAHHAKWSRSDHCPSRSSLQISHEKKRSWRWRRPESLPSSTGRRCIQACRRRPHAGREEAPSEIAEVEGDHERKLEEVDAGVEANGAGEDANRPRVEGNVQVQKIQITKDVDVPSNVMTRPVELFGTHMSIDKAEQLIKSVIAEAEPGGSPTLIAKGFWSRQPGSE